MHGFPTFVLRPGGREQLYFRPCRTVQHLAQLYFKSGQLVNIWPIFGQHLTNICSKSGPTLGYADHIFKIGLYLFCDSQCFLWPWVRLFSTPCPESDV